ncbi:MAG TPA: hypothetical protein VKY19_22355 [Ktedonosporobacter sp.]|jgi:hypothetical protein|nr:hypothetical protein [Ktedonosporobacter sp.]
MRLQKYLALKLCSSFLLMSVLGMTTLLLSNGTQAATCSFTPCTLNANVAFTVASSTLTSSVSTPVVNGGHPIILTGHDQTIGFTFVVGVNDARGNGAGWRVTASSPGLNIKVSGPSGPVIVNEPFKLSTSIIPPIVVTCQSDSTCSPVSGLARPPVAGSLATPLILESAPLGQGLGAFNITTNGQFFLPGNTLPGNSYAATVTVVVANTP